MMVYMLESVPCSCGGWCDSIFGKCNRCGKSAMRR